MLVVYVLKSDIQNKSYVGVTNDMKRRLKEHNSGKNLYTKRYLPWKVIHMEGFDNFTGARKREKFLKSTTGRRFLKKIFNKTI